MRPRAALLLLLAACAAPQAAPVPQDSLPATSPRAPTPVPSDTPPQPVPAASPAPVPAASPDPAPDLLGQPRPTLEARLGPPRDEQAGWSRYTDVDLQYQNGRSIRLRRTAPAGLDCVAVATWAGFPNKAGFPLHRASGCEWPGLSERHRLAPGIAASYDAATRRFEAWLRD